MQQLAALLNANCLKGVSGHVYAEGSFPATRFDLDRWMKNMDREDGSHGFSTVWIYDHLQPHAAALMEASHHQPAGLRTATEMAV